MKKCFRYILTCILSLVIMISLITSDLLCVNSYALVGVDDTAIAAILYELMVGVGGATVINSGGASYGTTVTEDDLAQVGYNYMNNMTLENYMKVYETIAPDTAKKLETIGLSAAMLYEYYTDPNRARDYNYYRNAYNSYDEIIVFYSSPETDPDDDDDDDDDEQKEQEQTKWWKKKNTALDVGGLASMAAGGYELLYELTENADGKWRQSLMGTDSTWFAPILDYYDFTTPLKSTGESKALVKFNFNYKYYWPDGTTYDDYNISSYNSNSNYDNDYSLQYRYLCVFNQNGFYQIQLPIYIASGNPNKAERVNCPICFAIVTQDTNNGRCDYNIQFLDNLWGSAKLLRKHYDNGLKSSVVSTTDSFGLPNFNNKQFKDFQLNSFSGLCFESYDDAVNFFDSLLIGNYNAGLLTSSNVIHKATPKDFVKNNTFENQFKNVNYVTTSELLNYLNHMNKLSPDVYNDYNSYIQEGNQYVTNNFYVTNSTEQTNPSTNPLNDSSVIQYIYDIASQARIIGNDLVNLPAYCNQMLTNVSALPQQIADAIAQVLPDVFPQYDPEKYPYPYPYPYPWPYPDTEPKPEENPEPVPDPETETDPDPVTDPIEIPQPPYDVNVLNWPEFKFEWPSKFPWPDLVGEVDLDAIEGSIDTNLRLPDGFNEFKGLYVDPFTVRYSSITYPVFKIDTPDILKPFVNKGVIVLYDTSDHKDLFVKVRGIIEFALYFGLVMWLIKAFKNQIEYTGES